VSIFHTRLSVNSSCEKLLVVVQWFVLVRVYFLLQLLFVFGEYVLVGAGVVHYANVAKVASSYKFYFCKRLFAIAAFVSSNVKIRKGFKPRITPEERHMESEELRVFFLLLSKQVVQVPIRHL
jgi:hypothetical protein